MRIWNEFGPKYKPGTYPPGIVVAAGGRPPSASLPQPVVKYETIGKVSKQVKQRDEGIVDLRAFILQAKPGDMYSLLMEHEGKFDVCHRPGQPCIGSMRRYGNRSSRPDDYFPGDLRTAERTFPEGNPVAVAWPLHGSYGTVAPNEDINVFLKEGLLSSSASPWRHILDGHEVVLNNEGKIMGLILHETRVPSTFMINFLRHFRYASAYATKFATLLRNHPKVDPRVLVPAAIAGLGTNSGQVSVAGSFTAFGGGSDISLILKGEPLVGVDEGTFYDRHAYNRPLVDYVFGYNPLGDVRMKGTYPNIEAFAEKALSFA